MIIKNARLAFPAIFSPKAVGDSPDAAYGCSLILDPLSIPAIEKAVKEAAIAKWGVKGEATLASLKKTDKTCLHDGDGKSQYDGFAGNWFVATRAKLRPVVVDRDRTPLTEADGKPYGGCYVHADIEIWAQDNKFGKRINAQLKGLQFVKDGTSFGGGAPGSADAFDDLAVEEDDDIM